VQVDFESYARLGVDLVSSQPDELEPADPLSSLDGLRDFLGPWPWMVRRAEATDLPPLVRLRGQLRAVFADAAAGRSAAMVDRINHLLARHRPQPSISGHDDSDWHLHIADDRGPVATEFATGAVMGMAMALLDLGADRFGTCADPRCGGVFIDASRNRSRRYCSDRCASRANVAAHRERQRSGAL
jgi:predicted RNA-binding Zn ribbon-like protein